MLYYPVESPVALQQSPQHRPHVEPTLWPEVARRARHESLRALAVEYGVSHETIRTIVRREARKQVAGAARGRLAPSAERASQAGEASRQLAAGSSWAMHAPVLATLLIRVRGLVSWR